MYIISVGAMGALEGYALTSFLKFTIMLNLNTLTRSFPTYIYIIYYIGSPLDPLIPMLMLDPLIPTLYMCMLMLVLLNFVARIFQELFIMHATTAIE